MIAGIVGKIIKKGPTYVDLFTAGGVIYRVFISVNGYSAINSEEVKLVTTPIYREDAQLLYGFLDENEQRMFEMLIKINGVGPKVAMAVCSTFVPSTFAQIVQDKDINALKRVPGIGPKSAGVIMVQLGGFSVDMERQSPTNKSYDEASQALESLGFKKEAIKKVLKECKSTDTGELVKEALKYFQK
jgi:holliday junction DNA helicase RuvA